MRPSSGYRDQFFFLSTEIIFRHSSFTCRGPSSVEITDLWAIRKFATDSYQYCHSCVQVSQNWGPQPTVSFETGYHFVASYNSRSCDGGALTLLHTGESPTLKPGNSYDISARSTCKTPSLTCSVIVSIWTCFFVEPSFGNGSFTVAYFPNVSSVCINMQQHKYRFFDIIQISLQYRTLWRQGTALRMNMMKKEAVLIHCPITPR
jgi:hypothetical protein